MRHVNGVYTQVFNRRHGLVGHLFQGRFKAILVDRDAYLLALCRYVERNPVAAGLVLRPADWPWSSFQAHAGIAAAPSWLDSDALLAKLFDRPIKGVADRRQAASSYAELVDLAREDDGSFWRARLRGQVYLGDEAFVQRMQAQAEPARLAATAVPKAQRVAAGSWDQHLRLSRGDRDAALFSAYRSGGFTMTRLAALTGLSVSHVSRLIAGRERSLDGGKWET